MAPVRLCRRGRYQIPLQQAKVTSTGETAGVFLVSIDSLPFSIIISKRKNNVNKFCFLLPCREKYGIIRNIMEKWGLVMSEKRKELLRTLKFVAFSISAGVIQIGADVLCNEGFGLRPSVSYIISLVLSVLWNFTLNRKFTFHSAGNVPVAMIKVACFYLVFAPLSTWWTEVLTMDHGWNTYVVQGGTMLINFVTEYLFQRFVVFGKTLDTDAKQ
ncbi:MAG: GtrA family protein [Ruminococcaceae bacterium]|nr:GtrA family protein [Oscillospiraceae bacterium]